MHSITTKTVQHILSRKVHRLVCIEPDATVYEALMLMAQHDIGSLVVLDGERLTGIFSERDYARQIVLLGKSSKETHVREIMTHKVLCVRPDQTVHECMGLMTAKRVRHLPVLEHKKVIGVISIGDVVKEVISDQQHIIEQLEHYIHSCPNAFRRTPHDDDGLANSGVRLLELQLRLGIGISNTP